MSIKYYSTTPSVKCLIDTLQKLVTDNPAIDFSKVSVTMNSGEYTFNGGVALEQWAYCNDGTTSVCVDIY